MIPLTTPVFTKEMESAAIETLNNEMFVAGESVNKFEEEFSRYIGTDYAITVNSGSSALLLTFNALDLKAGEKFAAPSATFIATFNGPTLLGGLPVFCEIGQDYLLSKESLLAVQQKNDLKYAIPVHLYGHPCKMDELLETG
jgi:dTDP-4-amino-4,6-dideoxygalactose transaminase